MEPILVSRMPNLQEVLRRHLEATGKSVRAVAMEAGLGYQVVLGIVNRGSIPRRAEHRELLRKALGIGEDEWAEILMASDGAPEEGSDRITLQQIVSREMYARGMTEQVLAKEADVAYSTVMGITRKGTIPREDSLRRISQVLGIDEEELARAASASRSFRRHPEARPKTESIQEPPKPLVQLVADVIQQRNQSIGAFARDLGIGYLGLSRFLETGEPPQDEQILDNLRRILGLDEERFEQAKALSAEQHAPAAFAPKDSLLEADANALQKALVGYMREHALTLKALAKRAGLSQVTVSRLVKQGQAPTRATTHLKLQELLGMDPDRYQHLVGGPAAMAAAARGALDESDEEDDNDYLPHEVGALPFDRAHPPTRDELVALVKRLGPKQREALQKFLATLV